MFDEKKYRESFSVIHASSNLLPDMEKATYKKRERYVSKAIRIAIACLALVSMPAATVLAYNYFKSVSLYFDGDTQLIEPDIQVIDETVEEAKYKVHVDSILADSYSTILGLSIEALSDEAKNELISLEFDLRDIICFGYEGADVSFVSMTYKTSDINAGESIRNFAIRLDGLGAPNTIKVYLKNNEESAIELNIDKQVEMLSATALPTYKNSDYFISSCELSATQITYEIVYDEPVQGDKIVEIYFRKADGSLITLQQLAGNETEIKLWHVGDLDQNTYRYTQSFSRLINPLSIVGVVMNGVEYSFVDDDYSTEVDIPEPIKPFTSPFVERNSTFYVYAYDACKKMGATIENVDDKYTINYLDNTMEFSIDDNMIYFNGEEKSMESSAMLDGPELLIPSTYIDLLGARIMMYYPEKGKVQPPTDWLITP